MTFEEWWETQDPVPDSSFLLKEDFEVVARAAFTEGLLNGYDIGLRVLKELKLDVNSM